MPVDGTLTHTPNSTVTPFCRDAPRLLLLGLGLRRVRGLVCRYRHVADVGASLYCPYSRLVAVATAYSPSLACLLVLPWARWPCVAACHALGPFERAGGVCHRCLWGTVGAGAQFRVWWTGLRHVRPLESSVGEGGCGIWAWARAYGRRPGGQGAGWRAAAVNGHVLCLAEILIAIVDSSTRLHAAACSESLMVGFTRDRSVSCCPCKTIDQQMSVTHRMDILYRPISVRR